jgi:predicted dienelactone hydrolase
MQYLEFILIIISTVYVLFYRAINNNINKTYVIGLLIFILSIHLLFNGYRLQMIPAYIIWLISIITAFLKSNQTSVTIVRVLKIIGLVIILALSIAIPLIFPVFDLPQPTGPYKVGTKDIHLILDRDEVITADKADKRALMIKVWYPSNETEGEQDPYIDEGGRHGFAQKYGLPNSAFNYLDKIETHVYRDINIAKEKFPVLIFSHGYNSKANSYYALLSEIVSQGYVVFAVNHTYESTGTTFPDGTEVYFDYDYARSIEKDTWHKMEPVKDAFRNDLSFEQRHPIVKKGLSDYFVRVIIERWSKDIEDVVDELNNWNNNGFFKGNLDLSNIGVFGHSRGGGAAGESLLIDCRIKAGANIDGVQWGQIVDTIFQKPFLFISADWPAEHEDLNQHAYVNKSNSYFYESTIFKSAHSNFMDIPYMIPVKALSQAGDIDPDLAIEITSKVVTAFFDKHLKNKETDLNALNSEYEMLDLNIFKGDSINQ